MKIKHLIYIRRISQVLFLLFFLFLLIETRLPKDFFIDYSLEVSRQQDLRLEIPVTFFFDIDPLVWLSALLSSQKWISGTGWALAIIGLTLFLGRFFCGFICPFGTLHHAIGAVRPSAKGSEHVSRNEKIPAHKIKYAIFLLVMVSALFGLNLAGIMDPISFLFRFLAVSIMPAINIGIKEVFDAMAASDFKILSLLSYTAEILVSPILGFGYPAYQTGFFIGLVGLVILFLNRIRPRFWCRILCPLGAMFGLISYFSPLRLERNENRCTGCNKCMKHCQGAASPKPDIVWENSECVRCFNCQGVCPENALTFKFKWHGSNKPAPDIGRRAVLISLGTGVAFPFLSRLDGQIHHSTDARLIRPPGSLPEDQFLELCQRCGMCMKVCPTNAIQPSFGEAGIAGFWTPVLNMTIGYCEYSCTLCTSICPTGAIELLSGKDKRERPVRIGSSFVDRGKCLPWTANGPCIVCEEVCPTSPKAIVFQEGDVIGFKKEPIRLKQPYVNLQQCIGCGICENKCPVKGVPAIRVISSGESRSPKNQILLFS